MATSADAAPIRMSITLPASTSLGAFQAGAVSALSVMIRSLRSRGQPVVVDAVGGASAGSIVAALFAHCLVSGRDAPALLRQEWVDEVDIGLLRSGGELALISPLLRARQTDSNVSDLLAGDFIGAFGGFLDKAIRRSDFGLGWKCTAAWVEQELADQGFDQVLTREAIPSPRRLLDRWR